MGMNGGRENELIDAVTDAVAQRLRTVLVADLAKLSDAISGLVAAQVAITGELHHAGALGIREARSALERALETVPAKERKSRKAGVLRDLARMLGELEMIELGA
ncbi:MAG: hypothetical protein ACLQME_12615 [Alphaproteobacteria bacterium]